MPRVSAINIEATRLNIDPARLNIEATGFNIEAARVNIDLTRFNIEVARLNIDLTGFNIEVAGFNIKAARPNMKVRGLVTASRAHVAAMGAYPASPISRLISPTPSMRPLIRSPGTTAATPSGVPVKIRSPGCRW